VASNERKGKRSLVPPAVRREKKKDGYIRASGNKVLAGSRGGERNKKDTLIRLGATYQQVKDEVTREKQKQGKGNLKNEATRGKGGVWGGELGTGKGGG